LRRGVVGIDQHGKTRAIAALRLSSGGPSLWRRPGILTLLRRLRKSRDKLRHTGPRAPRLLADFALL
jgi:hypothetical protein